jgi:hypothetical protein
LDISSFTSTKGKLLRIAWAISQNAEFNGSHHPYVYISFGLIANAKKPIDTRRDFDCSTLNKKNPNTFQYWDLTHDENSFPFYFYPL